MHQVLQQKWISKRELARLLVPHGFTVSGETLNRWVRDEVEMDPAMVLALEAITGLPLTTEEAPRPKWAEGLATKDELEEMIAESIIPVVARQVVSSLREAGLLPPVAPVHDNED